MRKEDVKLTICRWYNLIHKKLDNFHQTKLFNSVQLFSRVQLFVTPWPQNARPPCPSPTPGVYSNSCPLNQWCHPTISSSVIPFFSCPLSFPASGSFPMSQFFASGGLSTGVSALTSFLPMNTQDWSPGLVGSPCSPRNSQESSPTSQFKSINSLVLNFHYRPTLTFIHDYWKQWMNTYKYTNLLRN